MRTTSVVLSQLIFLYQFCRVTGWVDICGCVGSVGGTATCGSGVAIVVVGLNEAKSVQEQDSVIVHAL